jgi:hypothetical protein
MRLLDRIISLNILNHSNSIINYVSGKKFRVIAATNGNISGHTYGPIGTIVEVQPGSMTISGVGTNNTHIAFRNLINGTNGNSIYLYELEEAEITVADLYEELTKAEKEEEEQRKKQTKVKDMIKYMHENEVQFFDEKEYKLFKEIRRIRREKAINDIDIAQQLAKII